MEITSMRASHRTKLCTIFIFLFKFWRKLVNYNHYNYNNEIINSYNDKKSFQ